MDTLKLLRNASVVMMRVVFGIRVAVLPWIVVGVTVFVTAAVLVKGLRPCYIQC